MRHSALFGNIPLTYIHTYLCFLPIYLMIMLLMCKEIFNCLSKRACMLHGLLASEDEIPAYLGKADGRMNEWVRSTDPRK